jgi:hypothetical protein
MNIMVPGIDLGNSGPGCCSVRLPHGKLSVHEEFSDAAIEAIEPFLRERS